MDMSIFRIFGIFENFLGIEITIDYFDREVAPMFLDDVQQYSSPVPSVTE
jgi:hypothetical protein